MNKVEKIKIDSNYLRGTLKESLKSGVTGALADDDQVIIKFHGSYQQDDRDARKRREEKKLERLYSFMLRLRIAAGKINSRQFLGLYRISKDYANEVIKITTRQTVQLHGVMKSNLKPTIQSFAEFGIDSIAACGDVNRNVMASIFAPQNAAYDEIYQIAQQISDHLLPKTNAYNEIWLDGEEITKDAQSQEPLYQNAYLPRKFKIVIAIPPFNDVDVYAHDIGLVAIIQNEILQGFNVIVGGGMGRTHGNQETFARLGDLAGYVSKEKILDALFQIAAIQRDFGNRQERAKSRFKYTIDKFGLEWFLQKFKEYSGFDLEKSRDFKLTQRADEYGLKQDYRGNYFYIIFIENGRLFGDKKEALKEIAELNLGNFVFTNNQNVAISDVKEADKSRLLEILQKYKILDETQSKIRGNALACVALNTCSLALAEAQRYLPSLLTKIENLLEKHQLQNEPISIRMTGCPNGCARPYLAEIAMVGKALGVYDLHLGGSFLGDRLNILYKENLQEDQILGELDGFFERYSKQENANENFGDFVFREIQSARSIKN